MRRVVVLPAPLGPSRPVISPSRASKRTPSTALTTPVLVLNDLCRLSAEIMRLVPHAAGAGAGAARGEGRGGRGSRRPPVEMHERRHVGQRLQARRVERLGIG